MPSFDASSDLASPSDEGQAFLSSLEKPVFRQRRSNSLLRSILSASLPIVLTALLTSGFVCLVLFAHLDPRPAVMRKPCGSSAAEARAAGCNFDIISFAWFPDACYDAELSRTFGELQEWQWFLDVNQTQEVSRAEALTGEYPVLYVNWDYHITHCTYMWKKMHRAVLGRERAAIDMYIGPYEHTEHCAAMLLSNREVRLDTVNTGIRVKYPDCGLDLAEAVRAHDGSY